MFSTYSFCSCTSDALTSIDVLLSINGPCVSLVDILGKAWGISNPRKALLLPSGPCGDGVCVVIEKVMGNMAADVLEASVF